MPCPTPGTTYVQANGKPARCHSPELLHVGGLFQVFIGVGSPELSFSKGEVLENSRVEGLRIWDTKCKTLHPDQLRASQGHNFLAGGTACWRREPDTVQAETPKEWTVADQSNSRISGFNNRSKTWWQQWQNVPERVSSTIIQNDNCRDTSGLWSLHVS